MKYDWRHPVLMGKRPLLLVGFAHALQLCDHKLIELQRCRWLRH